MYKNNTTRHKKAQLQLTICVLWSGTPQRYNMFAQFSTRAAKLLLFCDKKKIFGCYFLKKSAIGATFKVSCFVSVSNFPISS